MEGDKRETRKRGETSRSTERRTEESKEKEEGNKKDTYQQLIEMMQAEKQERAEKEVKEKQEKEQRRKQKDEEKEREKQERDEKEYREKQEKEDRRREKEQEKLKEKQEIMQKFESLEKRILDSEENFDKKIESMIKRKTEQMKEEMENKLAESNKEMEKRMDVQDIHLKEIKEKICQDNLEVEGNIVTIGNKIEGVEESIGTIKGKMKDVEMQQINQQQRLDRVQQEIGNIRQGTGIENMRVNRPEIFTQPPMYYGDNRVHPRKPEEEHNQSKEEVQTEIKATNEHQEQEQQLQECLRKTAADKIKKSIEEVHARKPEVTTQPEIIYGDMKFRPYKQIYNIQRHLQEIERVNEKAYEEDIIYNMSHTFKRKTEIWDRIEMKFEKALTNKIWGLQECQGHYPLIEGKKKKNCNIYEEHKAKIPEKNQLKQLDSNITENELCKRDKRWKWSQESDDANVRYKRGSLLKSSFRIS